MKHTDHLIQNYAPMNVTFSHGKGCMIIDDEGKEYLDALAGIAVCGLGHAHPVVAEAICKQANKLIHTSNLYQIQNQNLLAEKLFELSNLDRVFFSNSGAEANEAAIKLARLYGRNKGVKTPTIVVMDQSFHGRTMATLSATGNRKVQAGFEPLVSGFVRAPFDDIDAIEKIAKNNSDVIAVMVEPIQGEGGIRVPSTDYLNKLRALCDANEWLLILDEIQTGMGRTGKWFAHQHNDIRPDIMTLAKALGNGVPIGACLANDKTASVMKPGTHGSTFGGNPLACAAALAVIDIMLADDLVNAAHEKGQKLMSLLDEKLLELDCVKEIRGKGLMIGIELDKPCKDLPSLALEEGLLFSVQDENVIRLLPPLIIDDEQLEIIVDRLCKLIINWSTTKA